MNCFNHPDVPAIGLCKYCQKGLCKECAIDLGHGIACSNHRLEVTALKEIHYSHASFNREKSIQDTVTRYRLLSLFLYCCTVVVVAMGFLIGGYGTPISIFVGIVIFAFGLMTSVDANKLSKSK